MCAKILARLYIFILLCLSVVLYNIYTDKNIVHSSTMHKLNVVLANRFFLGSINECFRHHLEILE